jgi:DNA-binding response OmpR family regulator
MPQIPEAFRGKPVVLIVDDNHDLVDFLTEELNAEFEVLTSYDGVEALEILRTHEVDVVVTDLMMPHMDGIELCRRIKSSKSTAGIPVIILTAKQDIGTEVEGLSIGADDFLTKPFNNDVLRLKIRRLAEVKRKGLQRNLLEPEPEPIKITSLDKQFIDRAVKYVEDNISRSDLSVEELSREIGMSRVNLYKKLLQITGKTPIEFIRLIRLKRGAQYLRESQLNVSEIAYKVGFNNHKYFSKYFHEEYGISPSEYQKKEGI